METENAWRVTIDQIIDNDYNLVFENPNKLEQIYEDPDVLLKRFNENKEKVDETIVQLRDALSEILFK